MEKWLFGQSRGLVKRQWQVSGVSVIQSSLEEETKIFVLLCTCLERMIKNGLVCGAGAPLWPQAEAEGSSSLAWKTNVVFMSQVGL